jgi:hypothetical protein
MTVRSVTIPCLLVASLPGAAQQLKAPPDPVLVSLQAKLERELQDLKLSPGFEVPASSAGKTLIMRYKTREYQVHPESKAGRLGPGLEGREGPDDEGILLQIHLEQHGEIHQAVVPQTRREPYWSTFLNVYPIAGTGKQIYLALSFRGGTDPQLIEKIKAFAKQQGKGDAPKRQSSP